MLDSEFTKQLEKRGRFLIQEIEEDICSTSHVVKQNQSEKLKTNLLTINSSKRTKHSSIIMDSKIFYTTRVDSNYSNPSFTCFIYEENTKDWIDFDRIWKRFSKVHGDLCEDDMEKIFHYIDKKIDDSDFFCVNSYANLQSCNVVKKISSENEHKINENYIENITYITNTDVLKKTEDNYPFQNNLCENENGYNSISDKNLKTVETKYKNINHSNKSIFLTNFCDYSFISPAVSPINSNSRILNFSKKFFDKNINEMNMKEYEGVFNPHSEKVKTKTKIFLKKKFKNEKKNLICENLSFSIIPSVKKEIKLILDKELQNKIVNETNYEVKSLDKNSNIHDDGRCSKCKNKI